MDSFLDRLRCSLLFLRRCNKLSQSQLAERAGISTRNYQRIESGELVPKVSTLYKLTEALEVPLEKIIKEPKDGKSFKSMTWEEFSRILNHPSIAANPLLRFVEENLKDSADAGIRIQDRLKSFLQSEWSSNLPLFQGHIDHIKFNEKACQELRISQNSVPYKKHLDSGDLNYFYQMMLVGAKTFAATIHYHFDDRVIETISFGYIAKATPQDPIGIGVIFNHTGQKQSLRDRLSDFQTAV